MGAVAATSLGTAVDRGGTMIDATDKDTWSSKGPTSAPSSTSLMVTSAATVYPVSASKPMGNLRQDQRKR